MGSKSVYKEILSHLESIRSQIPSMFLCLHPINFLQAPTIDAKSGLISATPNFHFLFGREEPNRLYFCHLSSLFQLQVSSLCIWELHFPLKSPILEFVKFLLYLKELAYQYFKILSVPWVVYFLRLSFPSFCYQL